MNNHTLDERGYRCLYCDTFAQTEGLYLGCPMTIDYYVGRVVLEMVDFYHDDSHEAFSLDEFLRILKLRLMMGESTIIQVKAGDESQVEQALSYFGAKVKNGLIIILLEGEALC